MKLSCQRLSIEDRFPETVETQPELVAHHYTAAKRTALAIPYWLQAGQRAVARFANVEAEAHLTTGLDLLTTMPETLERAQQELTFQLALGGVLVTTKSIGAREVEHTYLRAQGLCKQTGDTSHLVMVMLGLWRCYHHQRKLTEMRELEDQLWRLAETAKDSSFLMQTYFTLGGTPFWHGEMSQACKYFARGIALYDPKQHHAQAASTGNDSGVACYAYLAFTLWHLGYPNQALQASQKSLALAQEVAQPLSVTYALTSSAWLHQLRREVSLVRAQAEAAVRLATEQKFPHWVALSQLFLGWALVLQGQNEAGLTHLDLGLTFYREQGVELGRTRYLGLLAEAYRSSGQLDMALGVLTEAVQTVQTREERPYEAELYRLNGELTRQAGGTGPEESAKDAEACFHKALEVAQHQEAKSWELRAASSLARLWQSQGKRTEARDLLAPVYNWFTEGFDTQDLIEAKSLLEELP